MFACLYSLSMPTAALARIAQDFTPRFEVMGPLVMLDVSGLSRLFGSPQEIGEQLRQSAGGPVRIAMASTQTAAALLALGRAGLTVVAPGEERETLAPMPVGLLGDLDRIRLARAAAITELAPLVPSSSIAPSRPAGRPPHVGEMWDALPHFESTLDRTTEIARTAHYGSGCGGGWRHPRDSHAATTTRRPRRGVTASRDTEHPYAGSVSTVTASQARGGERAAVSAPQKMTASGKSVLKNLETLLETLRRWGIGTFGAFAALPAGEVYERLGADGVRWQRLAQGEDTSPLVPWVPEDPFEASLDLEWPIEGLEPLSFILGRLLEPLAERLERADRGAAVLHTHLRLVSKDTHARVLQLPSPMRDPKTLRTLVLLDLEANPPTAAIDRVRLLVEPTPARVLQWTLFERAHPMPEQVSTLLARLSALMGEGRVGSPRLPDSWKSGAFAMERFAIREKSQHEGHEEHEEFKGNTNLRDLRVPATALRRFRFPVPARVQVQEGRPIRIVTDRRGVTGGVIVQAAGPWRSSGEWWNDAKPGSSCWDCDEWDVAMADGTIYRLSVEREVGQWFLEGVVD